MACLRRPAATCGAAYFSALSSSETGGACGGSDGARFRADGRVLRSQPGRVARVTQQQYNFNR